MSKKNAGINLFQKYLMCCQDLDTFCFTISNLIPYILKLFQDTTHVETVVLLSRK